MIPAVAPTMTRRDTTTPATAPPTLLPPPGALSVIIVGVDSDNEGEGGTEVDSVTVPLFVAREQVTKFNTLRNKKCTYLWY